MTTLKQRFATLRGLRPDISQADLARATGARPPSVAAWFSGETKSMKADTATKAAAVYGVNPHWLATGDGEMVQKVAHSENLLSLPTSGDRLIFVGSPKKIPRLSWDEVQGFISGMFTPPDDRLHAVATTPGQEIPPRAFMVEVDGDPMTGGSPSESIIKGSLLVCDPDQQAGHGDVVIAMHPKSNKPIVRRLIHEGGCWYLQAENQAYPLLEIDGPSAVLARATEVITRRML